MRKKVIMQKAIPPKASSKVPNLVAKVLTPVGLAAFTLGPALLLAFATDGVLIPLVWILANDAIGVVFGVLLYRRSSQYLPKIPAIRALASTRNRLILKSAT